MQVDDIIRAWRIKCRKKYGYRYRTLSSQYRFTEICELIDILKERLVPKEADFTDKIKNEIISSCVSENVKDAQQLASWKKEVLNDVNDAIFSSFNETSKLLFPEQFNQNESKELEEKAAQFKKHGYNP